MINPAHIYYAYFVLRGNKNGTYCHLSVPQKGLCRTAKSSSQKQEFRRDCLCFWTHSDVVNSHPHGPVVIDLFCGDRLGLVSQKYAQQQEETLVAINHTYRKREKNSERKQVKTSE